MYSIRLIPKEKLEVVLPFLQRINPEVSLKTLGERLKEMISAQYECVGVYHDDNLIGISGMWFLTKYYVGRHVEPDNVFIIPEYQGKGIGKLLMNWIFEYAKSRGCKASELNCYINNKEGQRFWENQGYELIAYHYQKKL